MIFIDIVTYLMLRITKSPPCRWQKDRLDNEIYIFKAQVHAARIYKLHNISPDPIQLLSHFFHTSEINLLKHYYIIIHIDDAMIYNFISFSNKYIELRISVANGSRAVCIDWNQTQLFLSLLFLV